MEKEKLRNVLFTICTGSKIQDLIEEAFPEIFPEEEYRIGMFFVVEGVLFFGQVAGKPDYCMIGKLDGLNTVFYRAYSDNGLIDFIFEFNKYRVVISHQAFRAEDKVSVYDNEKEDYVLVDAAPGKSWQINKLITMYTAEA